MLSIFSTLNKDYHHARTQTHTHARARGKYNFVAIVTVQPSA